MSKGGGFLKSALPAVVGFALGGPLGAELGLQGTTASVVGGALAGGLTSVATGGKFFPGAFGGATGGYGGGVDGGFSSLASGAGVGSTAATTAPSFASGSTFATANPWETLGTAAPLGSMDVGSFVGSSAGDLAATAAPAAASSGGFSLPEMLSNFASKPSNLIQAGSSLYGIMQSSALQKQADALAKGADPFGPYRAGYAQQLQALQANPSSITSLPGYEAGLEAIQRSMAAQGYTGSGNMMAALQKYGGDFYNQQVQTLSQLAGAGINPGTAAQLALEGRAGGLQGQMSSLGLGTGVLRNMGY